MGDCQAKVIAKCKMAGQKFEPRENISNLAQWNTRKGGCDPMGSSAPGFIIDTAKELASAAKDALWERLKREHPNHDIDQACKYIGLVWCKTTKPFKCWKA